MEEFEVQAAWLSGLHVGGDLWHADRERGEWTRLVGKPTDPWSERTTPDSKFVYVPDPKWVRITMVTHKKNGQVVVRTIVPDEGHLSERNLKFKPSDILKIRTD